jgi:DNA-binding IclR family transcriptional regulator
LFQERAWMIDVKSLKRTFEILNLYSQESCELGVSEVSKKLVMNKSTVSRLMANLESAAYLTKSPENRKYRLGKKVAELAQVFFSTLDLKAIAMPYIEELNKRINELVVIHAINGNQRYSVAWMESSQPVRRVMDPQENNAPLHAGAPGKLLLAFLPESRINQILAETGLPRFTPITITHRARLLQELAEIRRKGYAVSHGEHIELLSTVAAPVKNYLGQVVAALSVSWISRPTWPDAEEKYIRHALETAGLISRGLGFFG